MRTGEGLPGSALPIPLRGLQGLVLRADSHDPPRQLSSSAPSAPAWTAASSRQEASLTTPALLSVRGPTPPPD